MNVSALSSLRDLPTRRRDSNFTKSIINFSLNSARYRPSEQMNKGVNNVNKEDTLKFMHSVQDNNQIAANSTVAQKVDRQIDVPFNKLQIEPSYIPMKPYQGVVKLKKNPYLLTREWWDSHTNLGPTSSPGGQVRDEHTKSDWGKKHVGSITSQNSFIGPDGKRWMPNGIWPSGYGDFNGNIENVLNRLKSGIKEQEAVAGPQLDVAKDLLDMYHKKESNKSQKKPLKLEGDKEKLPAVKLENKNIQKKKEKIKLIESKAPEVKAPEVKAPEVKAPEVKAPEVKAPEVKTPEVKTPEVNTVKENDAMREAIELGQNNNNNLSYMVMPYGYGWQENPNALKPICQAVNRQAAMILAGGFLLQTVLGKLGKQYRFKNKNRASFAKGVALGGGSVAAAWLGKHIASMFHVW